MLRAVLMSGTRNPRLPQLPCHMTPHSPQVATGFVLSPLVHLGAQTGVTCQHQDRLAAGAQVRSAPQPPQQHLWLRPFQACLELLVSLPGASTGLALREPS